MSESVVLTGAVKTMPFSNSSTLASSLLLASTIMGCSADAQPAEENSGTGGPRASGGSSSAGGFTSTSGGTTGGSPSGSGGLESSGGSPSATGGSPNASGGAAGKASVGGAGSASSAGSGGVGGSSNVAGAGASGGPTVGGSTGKGTCCADGNCLCHGPNPTALTSEKGPYATSTLTMSTGTLHYPTDAEPPLAGISICPGFTNTGPEMAPWGPFYASWGIVVVVTNTEGLDPPNVRGDKLVAAIEELKRQNTGSGPLAGKLSDRYGTSGYSMGGGGTTFASAKDPTYKTSVGLAAWGPDGTNVKVPTLFLCSDTDTVAGCSFSQTAYDAMGSTLKMLLKIPNASHFNWFGPTDAGQGMSGKYALAFQKVYLEGDERWKPLLLTKPSQGTVTTNIP